MLIAERTPDTVEDPSLPAILGKVRSYCKADPDLSQRYARAKQVVRAFRTPSFYEMSTRCNLYCEGCYYFENSEQQGPPQDANRPLDGWRAFFAREAQRNVSMAYFVGAEPALHQDRLLAAAPYFLYGNIGSNGTIRIDPDVPFRIGVSVWAGDDDTDRKLRGGSVFRKAIRLYEGDPRAIMLFTISAWNIDQIGTVAQMCRDHGVELTFNFYSPTHAFNAKLAAGLPHDAAFFRQSTQDHSPCLDDDDLRRVRDRLDEVTEDFAGTVLYSRRFNHWITEAGPRYTLDASGIAVDCGSRIAGRMRYHRTDLKQAPVKCCTPDVDCATCRMYSGGWSSRFAPTAADVRSASDFSEWLDMIEVLGRIFLRRNPHHAPA